MLSIFLILLQRNKKAEILDVVHSALIRKVNVS
jgi:hypothetical protein